MLTYNGSKCVMKHSSVIDPFRALDESNVVIHGIRQEVTCVVMVVDMTPVIL